MRFKRFKCRVCGGTGEVRNPDYMVCENWTEAEEKFYQGGPLLGCGSCRKRRSCRLGEYRVCGNCAGEKYIYVDLELWAEETPGLSAV